MECVKKETTTAAGASQQGLNNKKPPPPAVFKNRSLPSAPASPKECAPLSDRRVGKERRFRLDRRIDMRSHLQQRLRMRVDEMTPEDRNEWRAIRDQNRKWPEPHNLSIGRHAWNFEQRMRVNKMTPEEREKWCANNRRMTYPVSSFEDSSLP